MDHPIGLEGLPFPVPDPAIGESCIDYWFDVAETQRVSADDSLVPEGYTAIARDPGDNLVLLDQTGMVFYACHETHRLIQLAPSLEAFYQIIESA